MAAVTDHTKPESASSPSWQGAAPTAAAVPGTDPKAAETVSMLSDPMARIVTVGIADLAVSEDHGVILTSGALGACVAVAVYDPIVQVGGLLHAMLPQSTIAPMLAGTRPAMFLDTGLPMLLNAMYELEADKNRMMVYIVGGAQIIDENAHFNLGRSNYRVAADIISELGLRVRAQDVGGPNNRTLVLSVGTGVAAIKIAGQPKEYRL